MLTFLFGATGAVDALQVAIIVPKAIYDLLIGGHVNGAIVPVLSDVITLRGKDELWRVVSALVSLIIAVPGGSGPFSSRYSRRKLCRWSRRARMKGRANWRFNCCA